MRGGLYLCVTLFLLSLLHSGNANLQCYSCSAPTGQRDNCERNVNVNTIPTIYCRFGYNTCMTLVMHGNITRACAQTNVCHIFQGYPGFVACSTCVTNLCNDSSKMSSPILPLGLFGLLSIGIRMWLS